MTDFGTCWSCTTDLTIPSQIASGFRAVGEAIVRRWYTPSGTLIDDPDYGYDLTDLIGDDLDANSIAQVSYQAAAEAMKDERVNSCTCTISFIQGKLTITGAVSTNNGPFKLVAQISDVTVTLLSVTS